MIQCSKCKQDLIETEFYKHPTAKSGYRYQCKSCHQQYGKDPQKRKVWSEHYYRTLKTTRPELFLWKQAKHRAKYDYNDIEFSIVVEDIVIPATCPYLGIQLTTQNTLSSPSLDRIDSNRGYTKDNIQVISWQANLMKSNASQETLLTFARGILALHAKVVK